MAFPQSVRQVRAYVLDYVRGTAALNRAFEAVKEAVTSKQLTKDEVLKVVGKIEEDPLSLPYMSREEKIGKLKPLKKLLADLADMEEA